MYTSTRRHYRCIIKKIDHSKCKRTSVSEIFYLKKKLFIGNLWTLLFSRVDDVLILLESEREARRLR